MVRAVKNGSGRITARSGSVSASIDVVVSQTAIGIKIVPADTTLSSIGETIQLVASVFDQNEQPLDGAAVTWSSSDDAVATVSAQGLVTSVNNGIAQVTARSGDFSADVEIAVSQSASSIHIMPRSPAVVSIGETIQLVTTVLDQNEHPVMGAVVVWSSSDKSIVTISAHGLVTGAKEGSAQVEARSGGATASILVIVSMQGGNPERIALSVFYYATDGPNWTNNTNWLSEEPLHAWYGVETDHDGGVRGLELAYNQLTGEIPPKLGLLVNLNRLDLYSNQLTGEVPPELGQLVNLKQLSLSVNRLTGGIPPELRQLVNLSSLGLGSNQLDGSIPPELGQLVSLDQLDLYSNQLDGSIPPELGQLVNLSSLGLGSNQLDGSIPPELGQLVSLDQLDLTVTSIPPELGQLVNLSSLGLGSNQLDGSIPPELGQLVSLSSLGLGSNQLDGSIPPELGQLVNLEWLDLSNNQLTEGIPPELGLLRNLKELLLGNNQLTGEIPRSFASLSNLRKLHLAGNEGLLGILHLSFTSLKLDELLLYETRLCAPEDAEIQYWLQTIPRSEVETCRDFLTKTTAFLIQATQSPEFSVPLVAGEDALLRVFIQAETDVVIPMPLVTARFFLNGREEYEVDIHSEGKSIPSYTDLANLETSVNMLIPGSVIKTGLEMVVEIDPDDSLGDMVYIEEDRLPMTGRIPVDVRDVPPLNLTLVPFLWMDNPDLYRPVLSRIEELTVDSDLFRETRDILPVDRFRLSIREPVWTANQPEGLSALEETQLVYIMDGKRGHYMGIVSFGGWSYLSGFSSVAALNAHLISHELGHNMSLYHAPCGTAVDLDNDFPYMEGEIGVWGYDLFNDVLISPSTADLMSYCGPTVWISDYNFTKAVIYRATEEQNLRLVSAYSIPEKSLLLWGGVSEEGELYLEPAFVVDVQPFLPEEGGPYRLAGVDADGNTLFRLNFPIYSIADSEGGAFAFTVPVRADWAGRLELITLSGHEGFVELTKGGGGSAALLLDESTGSVRGILRDWPGPGASVQAVRRMVPEPGLKVIVSTGIPDAADWER